MDTSKELALISELKQICRRLGEAVAGMSGDPAGSKEKVITISADLEDLRARIAGPCS